FDRRFQETELVAGIVSRSFEHVGIHGLLLEQQPNAVGELNFAAAVCAGFLQDTEDLGRQNVPADDRHIRGSLTGRRFFDYVLDAVDAAVEAFDRHAADHAILMDLGVGNFARRDYRSLQLFEQVDHLLHAWYSGIDDVVAEHHSKRL